MFGKQHPAPAVVVKKKDDKLIDVQMVTVSRRICI
jgi:hypothetical protein